MHTYESPYLSDAVAIALRWVVVLGLVTSLGLAGRLDLSTSWLLGPLVAWNIFLTAVASMNRRLLGHRALSVGVDLLISGGFFFFQGGVRGPAAWAGLLPILTGSIYFELLGGLGTAAAFSGLVLLSTLLESASFSSAIPGVLLLLALGALFGGLGRSLSRKLHEVRHARHEEDDVHRRPDTDRLRAIYEHTAMLSSTLSYRRVLDSALELGSAALSPDPASGAEDSLVGAVLLFEGDTLHVGSSRKLSGSDQRATFEGAQGILKTALDQGETVLSQDIRSDPELSRIVAFRKCGVIYCFPLRSGMDVYGALLFAHPDPEHFTADRRDLLDILGRQAVIAIQNARLYQDLVEEKERMVEVHEEARKKLARDLHDGPTQSVAAMALRIAVARRMLAQDPSAAAQELVRLEELAQRVSTEMRHMLFTLRPLILESQGLTAALQAMADKMLDLYHQKVIVKVDEGVADQLELGKQGVVFYIVEEAVNNARKHANASTIGVRLIPVTNDIALLEILDDGIGFNVNAVEQGYDQRAASSLGMVNLRERTELVSGALEITSEPGRGTRVQVYVPLTEGAADLLYHARGPSA